MTTKCAIVPEYVFAEIVQKTVDPVEKSKFQSMLMDVHNFVNNLGEFKLDGTMPMELFGAKAGGRNTHDCENGMKIPGKLALTQNDTKSHKSKPVNDAHRYAGSTFDFFKEKFNRNSIDDKGMTIVSNANYGRNYNNAFWYQNMLTMGNGDGVIMTDFSALSDVIAHEISHGVTEKTAGLIYSHESGALNESFSDIFGIMVKHYINNTKSQDDSWLIGEGLWGPDIDGVALRSMKAPGTAYSDSTLGKDPQPDHWDRYVRTEQDAGGVHINSSIQNKAFYEACMISGGYSFDKIGQIFYRSLTTKLKPNSQYKDAVAASVLCAKELYGAGSAEEKAIREGWKIVGLTAK